MIDLFRTCWLACVCIALVGCSGRNYEGEQRFPVSGELTYDGEPMDAGSISFLPMGGGDAQRVSGGPIADGGYSIKEADGPNAGTYRVEIHWAKKTGKQFRDAELDLMTDARKEALPPRFHDKSELTVEISDDQIVHDFHLKSTEASAD